MSRARQQYGTATLATLGPTYAGASLPSTTLAARFTATQRHAAGGGPSGSLAGSLAGSLSADEDAVDWLDTQERRGIVGGALGGTPGGSGAGPRRKRQGMASGTLRSSVGGGDVFLSASTRAADSMLLELDEEGFDGWQVRFDGWQVGFAWGVIAMGVVCEKVDGVVYDALLCLWCFSKITSRASRVYKEDTYTHTYMHACRKPTRIMTKRA